MDIKIRNCNFILKKKILNALKEHLSKDDYDALIIITDNTKEKHFIKKKDYFLILTSNENNLIYLFITQTPEGEIKTQFLQ